MPVRTARAAPDVPPHLTGDGSIRHPHRIATGEWRDPDDTQAMERDERGRAHQATVRGYRVADPLDRLPCDAEQRRAAGKLRWLHDIAEGVRAGKGEKVDGGRSHEPTVAQLDAITARREAFEALGVRACAFVVPVVLSGWTVADLVARHGGNAMAVQGRVMAALDRLVEHFYPPQERATIMVPALLDRHGVTDLPAERLGRV